MSDKYNSLTVVLEKDISQEEKFALVDAIELMRGVISVEGNVSDFSTAVATRRAKVEMINKMMKVLEEL